MLLLVVCTILILCGIILLVLPKKMLVNPNNLKQGQTEEKIVKQYRIYGLFEIILGIFLFIINK